MRTVFAIALVAALPISALAQSADAPPGAAACTGCHPAKAGVQSPVPPLAGKSAAETVAQMQAFRTGQRPATVMDRIAKGFSEAETQAIADWYAQQH